MRRGSCAAEPNAMQDALLLAVVEAARRPTDPADSRFRTTARPGPSTSIRTIYSCGVPDWPGCQQWREPGGPWRAPGFSSFSASTWRRRPSTNWRDPSRSVFCDEIAADPSFRRRPSWTVDEAKVIPPMIHAPSATAMRVRVLRSPTCATVCSPNSSSSPCNVGISTSFNLLGFTNSARRYAGRDDDMIRAQIVGREAAMRAAGRSISTGTPRPSVLPKASGSKSSPVSHGGSTGLKPP